MEYIVYLTLNTVNRKIYIGVHGTKDTSQFDGYLGNGVFTNKALKHPKTPFQFAVKKYGFKAFERITLFKCNSMEEALEIEAMIVNEDFLKRQDVYNVVLGGGLPPLLNKEICQYTLDGKFVKQFNSIEEASKEMGASFAGCISSAISYKTVSFGYLWSFDKLDSIDTTEYNNYLQKIKVFVYNENREYVGSYDSLSEAANALNIPKYTTISNCIKSGRLYKNLFFSNKEFDILPPINQFDSKSTIYQYSLDGTYIKTFGNRKEVKKELGSTTGLSDAIYKSIPFIGYRWSINKMDKLTNLQELNITSKGKKVGQYSKEGELVKIYDTVRECRKDFGNVSKVLSGKVTHCKNFIFKYIE